MKRKLGLPIDRYPASKAASKQLKMVSLPLIRKVPTARNHLEKLRIQIFYT